jgi:hypothetical protein
LESETKSLHSSRFSESGLTGSFSTFDLARRFPTVAFLAFAVAFALGFAAAFDAFFAFAEFDRFTRFAAGSFTSSSAGADRIFRLPLEAGLVTTSVSLAPPERERTRGLLATG